MYYWKSNNLHFEHIFFKHYQNNTPQYNLCIDLYRVNNFRNILKFPLWQFLNCMFKFHLHQSPGNNFNNIRHIGRMKNWLNNINHKKCNFSIYYGNLFLIEYMIHWLMIDTWIYIFYTPKYFPTLNYKCPLLYHSCHNFQFEFLCSLIL